MTVSELIELLKQFPQNVPVTGFNGQEETGLVTKAGVRLQSSDDDGYGPWDYAKQERYIGQFVDIMGF
jgi:hypothetical protein